ncbi:ATP-binding protein [Pacificispira sp.]|uniref:ATP-binding protein n=1 Tax=Pacificispira sp. TaxID=2888761 RepID=UPI003BAA90C7
MGFVFARHFAAPLPNQLARDALVGLLFGALIAVAMFDPIVSTEGAVFDLRGGPAILSAIFGGPIAAIIAAIVGACVRYFAIGGPVAFGGAVSFGLYAAFGIAARILIDRYGIKLTAFRFLILGLLGAVCVTPAFFVSVDAETGLAIIKAAGPLFLFNNLVSTWIVGVFILRGTSLLSFSQRLESEVRENTKLARIAHETTNAVIITDRDGYAEWANQGFERVSGYSISELIGKKPGQLLQGPESNPSTIRYMSEQLQKGEGFLVDIVNYTKSGTPYWLQINCQPYKDVDGSDKFLAIQVDISKTKEISEALAKKQVELQLVLNNLPGALVYTDSDLRIVLCTERMKQTYNVPGRLLAPGAYYPDLLRHLASRGDYGEGDVDTLVQARIDSIRTPSDQMFVDRLPDGKIYGVRRTKAPSGGTITVVTDVTEQVRLNERLEQAIERADLANRTKSEFLASMSHEIRTPMTGILGFSDILIESDLPQADKEKVVKIKQLADSLLVILNDILDISKLEAGKLLVEEIAFDPAKLANEVVHVFYQSCPPEKRTSLNINAKLGENFPRAVGADPTRLRQILVNLMGNAVKFTESGSVTLHCEAQADPMLLRFSVIDTGVGIRPEDQDKLFEDFVQADASTSRKYHGTGLGLAICKRLVELMGGEIGVESQFGRGSTFWFTLPYKPVSGQLAPREEQENTRDREGPPRALSVLVAEDNEINQTIVNAVLSGMGHRCTFASNGVDAVKAAGSALYDLILMDIRMPELDGTDAAKQIRELPAPYWSVPIIALTADVMADHVQNYLAAGMNDCIPKPINKDQLAKAIENVIQAGSVSNDSTGSQTG